MESIWPRHFLMSDNESIQVINEHKYRHTYGLQLPDQLFCRIYYSFTGRKFLSTHYYRKFHDKQTEGISLENIKVDFTKLQQNDKKTYVLKRFSAIYVYKPPKNCVDIPRDVCGLFLHH
eukprot:138134_1